MLRLSSPHDFNVASQTQEDDYAQLAAKHLYIQHGADSSPEHVKEAVRDCISGALLKARPEAKWVQAVSAAHAQVGHNQNCTVLYQQHT